MDTIPLVNKAPRESIPEIMLQAFPYEYRLTMVEHRAKEQQREQFADAIRPCFPDKTLEYDGNGILWIK
jgi:hypothetical protein